MKYQLPKQHLTKESQQESAHHFIVIVVARGHTRIPRAPPTRTQQPKIKIKNLRLTRRAAAAAAAVV